MLDIKQQEYLLALARDSICAELEDREITLEILDDEIFQQKFGAFVTLKIDDELRGCIGYVEGVKSIIDTIIEMAKAAAFEDPRFLVVRKDEMEYIQIEISILSPLKEVESIDEIEIGRDGLIIRNHYSSGLLLPQVAIEWDWDKNEFLEQTCQKAGLDKEAWKSKGNKLLRFSADFFSEKIKKRI